jgi:hypothetical protein
VNGLGDAIETLLRQPHRVIHHLRTHGPLRLAGVLTLIALLSALGYGLVIGSFSGGAQWWAAPIKVAVGLLLSCLICIPSLYIFACLSGSNARLGEIVGLVAGLSALMTILLIGFAPVAWVFSQSTESLATMGILHLGFWVVAVAFALTFLHQSFAQHGSRAAGIKVWMVIFVLVMVQMTTALRPLLGTADTFLPTKKRFFLSHWSEVLKQQADRPD